MRKVTSDQVMAFKILPFPIKKDGVRLHEGQFVVDGKHPIEGTPVTKLLPQAETVTTLGNKQFFVMQGATLKFKKDSKSENDAFTNNCDVANMMAWNSGKQQAVTYFFQTKGVDVYEQEYKLPADEHEKLIQGMQQYFYKDGSLESVTLKHIYIPVDAIPQFFFCSADGPQYKCLGVISPAGRTDHVTQARKEQAAQISPTIAKYLKSLKLTGHEIYPYENFPFPVIYFYEVRQDANGQLVTNVKSKFHSYRGGDSIESLTDSLSKIPVNLTQATSPPSAGTNDTSVWNSQAGDSKKNNDRSSTKVFGK